MRSIHRRAAGIAVATTMAVTSIGFASPALAADSGTRVAAVDDIQPRGADGCTAAPSGWVCGSVLGTGKYIEQIHVSRKGKAGNYCNYKGEYRLTNAKGATVETKSSSNKNCSFTAFFNWFPKKKYNSATKLCMTWWEEKKKQGTVCFNIK